MTGYLILFSVLLVASAVVIFSGVFDHFKCAWLPTRWTRKVSAYGVRFSGWINRIRCLIGNFQSQIANRHLKKADEDLSSSKPIDLRHLSCRVSRGDLKENDEAYDVFNVEICGTIHAPKDGCQIFITVSMLDVTEGTSAPVQTWMDQGTSTDGPKMTAFRRRVGLGRLPQQVTVLSEWTTVARIRIDSLLLARKGKRHLQLDASISSADNDEDLCRTRCAFTYDNPAHGYLDLQENAERTRVLAVALAFAVSAADNELCDCEIELIENWARDNILDSAGAASEKDARKLEKVLSRTVAFFREGNKLDTYRICKEIIELTPLAQRYDILDLCMYVARADGFVAAEELALLKDLADWLEVDVEKFRLMMERFFRSTCTR